MTPERIPLKTRMQIAAEFGFSTDTLRRRIKAAGIVIPSGDLPPTYQKLIYEAIHYPQTVDPRPYATIILP